MAAMLRRVEAKELMSLGRLIATHDGEILVEVLKQELAVVMAQMLDVDGVVLNRYQGRAKFLTDFIALLTECKEKHR